MFRTKIYRKIWKIFENSIMITLPVIETRGKLTRSEQQIIKLIEENGEMSRKEIEEEIGLGKATTIRMINDLVRREIIQKKGAGRAVRYIMN